MRYSGVLTRIREAAETDGYTLVGELRGQREAVELLQDIGRFLPQYSGTVEHEVVYRPGNDDRACSKSRNTIRVHTEAPGFRPYPRYLALYCHRQARCGGGHTDLLGLERLQGMLTEGELALLFDFPAVFPGRSATADGDRDGVVVPMVPDDHGRPALRFSYNLLTAADYDPVIDTALPPEQLPPGQPGADLAHRISGLFELHRTQVLIPDGALLIWDNQRMVHARSQCADERRHLIRYWIAA